MLSIACPGEQRERVSNYGRGMKGRKIIYVHESLLGWGQTLPIHTNNPTSLPCLSSPISVTSPVIATTQTADTSSKIKGLSLLVQRCLGKPLDKSQQFSDWERRPLLPQQINYAGKIHLYNPSILNYIASIHFIEYNAVQDGDCVRQVLKFYSFSFGCLLSS